jgi:hypothetical protein
MSCDSAGLSDEELERLERVCDDLALPSISGVPAVAAAARMALAHVASALSGQHQRYDLSSARLFRRDTRPSVYSPELKRELDRPRDLRRMGPSEAPPFATR